MAVAKILTLWDEDGRKAGDTLTLRAPNEDIALPLNQEGKEWIKHLLEVFLSLDDAVGLAAPQIGINKRIIVFRTGNFDKKEPIRSERDYEILVNPRVTQFRGEQVIMAEGCLSCPDVQVEIARYPEIKVRGYDTSGKKISKRYLDYMARVVQHELDHLEGRLIVDYDGNLYIPKRKHLFFSKLLQKT
jgi:peptide deformylase